MIFPNDSVRRQDRLLDEGEATSLLQQGEYRALSMQAEKSGSYGIPINYVWDNKHSIYLHCAPEGRKLRCIDLCNKVSFCVVGKTNIISGKFTTTYESIVLDCIAHTKLTANERMKALELLIDKYSPEYKVDGMKLAKQSFHCTEIIRLDIKEWSGKCKRVQ